MYWCPSTKRCSASTSASCGTVASCSSLPFRQPISARTPSFMAAITYIGLDHLLELSYGLAEVRHVAQARTHQVMAQQVQVVVLVRSWPWLCAVLPALEHALHLSHKFQRPLRRPLVVLTVEPLFERARERQQASLSLVALGALVLDIGRVQVARAWLQVHQQAAASSLGAVVGIEQLRTRHLAHDGRALTTRALEKVPAAQHLDSLPYRMRCVEVRQRNLLALGNRLHGSQLHRRQPGAQCRSPTELKTLAPSPCPACVCVHTTANRPRNDTRELGSHVWLMNDNGG